jgi:preprotein translocase subunit SecD
LYFTGDTLNGMTLGGLALAIGIILDQAIVVLENISRHLELGKPVRRGREPAGCRPRRSAGRLFSGTARTAGAKGR